ncbi:hypothetical protein FEM48_Zijuj05G0032600 [Ziziphus jujuba var. spinosa]|uniref:Flavin-containing monooxygenase n=1 Tax=Ziziphus jujuba var. spinosa TaxID=714518 RepID=A0A978VCI1_ZIZJJ|nr:hypothetical protein FEM48_Zijuj05G0032600 [Ziziphus jujuba var. spinosa]
MGRSVRAAVIGAGVAGLCAARELQRQGLKVVIFDKADRIGGTWIYDPRIESDPLGLDPTREIVHSSLYRSLRTNLPRQLMGFLDYPFPNRQNGDPRPFPGHEEVLYFLNKFADDFGLRELVKFNSEIVRVAPVDETKNDEWLVEWRTRGSDSLSREVFDAVVVCVGNFTEPETVVVIGFGASAFDISRDIATEAKEVHIAIRKPDVQVGKLESHNNIWHHKMIEQAYEDGSIAFQDGSLVYADTIVYCTGYRYHFPFLETKGIVTIEENRVGPLYKHIFPPRLAPWLSFIGIPFKNAVFPLVDIQSKWMARVLSGKVALPKEEEMMASTNQLYKQMEENGVPKCFTHALHPYEMEYQNGLLAEIGWPELEEWRGKVYAKSINFITTMHDGYKDQWDSAYWEALSDS